MIVCPKSPFGHPMLIVAVAVVAVAAQAFFAWKKQKLQSE
jgi:hypothetical protein